MRPGREGARLAEEEGAWPSAWRDLRLQRCVPVPAESEPPVSLQSRRWAATCHEAQLMEAHGCGKRLAELV